MTTRRQLLAALGIAPFAEALPALASQPIAEFGPAVLTTFDDGIVFHPGESGWIIVDHE